MSTRRGIPTMRSEARMRMDRHLAFEGRRPKSALFADETAKGPRRIGREQISGTIPPVMQALLDRVADVEGVTKQDLFAVCVNRVMDEYGACWAEPTEEQRRAVSDQKVSEFLESAAKKARDAVLAKWCEANGKDFRTEAKRRGGIERLLGEYLDAMAGGAEGEDAGDARQEAEDELIRVMEEAVGAIPDTEIERVRKTSVAEFERFAKDRVGKPFRLPLERDDPARGSLNVREYRTIARTAAVQKAAARLEFQSLLDAAGFEGLDVESRKKVVAEIYAGHPDLRGFMVDRGWTDPMGTPLRSERSRLAPSREGKRPFCAWFPGAHANEFTRLVAHGLGGAPTSKQKVVEVGVFEVILDNADRIRELDLADDEAKALDVIGKVAEIGDVSLAVGLLAKPESEWEEWLAKPTAPRLRRLAGKV